jgi:hypothetical protein
MATIFTTSGNLTPRYVRATMRPSGAVGSGAESSKTTDAASPSPIRYGVRTPGTGDAVCRLRYKFWIAGIVLLQPPASSKPPHNRLPFVSNPVAMMKVACPMSTSAWPLPSLASMVLRYGRTASLVQANVPTTPTKRTVTTYHGRIHHESPCDTPCQMTINCQDYSPPPRVRSGAVSPGQPVRRTSPGSQPMTPHRQGVCPQATPRPSIRQATASATASPSRPRRYSAGE